MGTKMKMPRHGIVPVALLKQDGIHESEIRVYIILSMYQGHDDEAYPSRAKICQLTGISESTASRAIDNLDRLGWIERVQRGSNQTNLYRVMFDPSMDDDSGSCTDATSGCCTGEHPDVAPMQHPSIKQKQHLQKSEKTKHKHGEFSHVLLTEDDLEKLKKEYPLDWKDRIKRLDEYIEMKGPKKASYANHLLTIRNWAKRDQAKSTDLFQTEQPTEGRSTVTDLDRRFMHLGKK